MSLTQKRTETKHTNQNRAKALLLDFFPWKVLIESQLSRSVSVYLRSVQLSQFIKNSIAKFVTNLLNFAQIRQSFDQKTLILP